LPEPQRRETHAEGAGDLPLVHLPRYDAAGFDHANPRLRFTDGTANVGLRQARNYALNAHYGGFFVPFMNHNETLK